LMVFAIGNAITAIVPDFSLVLASRVIAAAGAGLFTANASATAALLAGPQSRGRAIALVMLGLTSSLVFGAPLGTAVSNLSDWRMTMWLVTALGLLAGVVILWRLPDVRETGASGLMERFRPLRSRAVQIDLVCTLVVFTGVYIPYTYISLVYAPVTSAQPQWLGVMLLVFGVAGTAGNLLAGRLADRFGPVPVIVGGSLGLAVVFLLVPLLNTTLPSALIIVALSGLFAFSLTTPQQHLLISHAAGGKLSLITGLYQSAIYAAVSLSGVIGALAIGWGAADRLTLVAVVPIVLAALMTWQHARKPS
jgi:MFS transporter, DHA1 family, inner membrane transport protein